MMNFIQLLGRLLRPENFVNHLRIFTCHFSGNVTVGEFLGFHDIRCDSDFNPAATSAESIHNWMQKCLNVKLPNLQKK